MPRSVHAALLVLALSLGWLAGPRASAIEPLLVGDASRSCDASRAPPPKICADFEAAPGVSLSDPLAVKALKVWSRVAEPVEALTDRTTGVVLLAPTARMRDGRQFPPATYICPGAPPVVYVPWSLLDAVYGPSAAYPEDFLAFVLGHELGHRMNDFTGDGCQLGAFERPGKGLDEERLADFRGAFFAAVGGFDTRGLATSATVTRFLSSEFKVRSVDLDARAGALSDALRYFDAYEALYQTGLALTLAGEGGAAVRLLDWADELVESHGVPVPEITLGHALALIADAAPDAPWLERVHGLAAPAEALVCRPLFPAHSAFREEPHSGPVRADHSRRAAAERALERALRLLQKADDLGANPLAVGTGKACAAFLLGEPGEALRHQERAVKRGSARGRRGPSAAVGDALLANEALFRFAAWLGDHPAATLDDLRRDALPLLPTFALHPGLGRWLRGEAGPGQAPLALCKARGPAPEALAPAPFATGETGACPAGWTLAQSLPAPDARAATGSGTGITLCQRGAIELAHVILPPLSDPPRGRFDATLAFADPLPAALQSFDTWACQCEALAARGTSDAGETVWLGACPKLGAATALVRVDERGRVRGVAVLPLP